MSGTPKSWLDQLLGAAIVIAISVWLLAWAWQLARPLVPVAVALIVAGVLVRSFWRRHSGW